MFIWKEEYSVGIKELDHQHNRLVHLINDLEKIGRSKEYDQLDHIIAELFRYAAYHLRFEEGLLKEHNYPDYESHKKTHIDFEGKMAELSIRLETENKKTLYSELAIFLYDWLINHIERTDKMYSSFLKEKGLK